MRLIDADTFVLTEFNTQPPLYAILSHTWGDEEVTFQDMADLDTARKKKGFDKIRRCCRQALRDGLDWVWVDTCCIDKTSSAELSETINSMFRWYERAMKCYAFLSDCLARPNDDVSLHREPDATGTMDAVPNGVDPSARLWEAILKSRWWTRGWTLQELIAPHDVEFYNRRWEYLTTKRLCKESISLACGIPTPALDHSRTLASFCVAGRISWASKRNTTRDEDMAYCLLGLLDVNMPLLYGEGGRKAFLRLQEHVIDATEDYTLFLWGLGSPPVNLPDRVSADIGPYTRDATPGILASSPHDFGPDRAWSEWSDEGYGCRSFGYGEIPQLTSRGLRLSLYVRQVTEQDLNGSSDLSRTLVAFLEKLYRRRIFLPSLRRRLLLGAFQCVKFGTGGIARYPCVLLWDTHCFKADPPSDASPRVIGTYDRFGHFFWKLTGWQLNDPTHGWKLETCYIRATRDLEPRHLVPQDRDLRESNFSIWRTPSRDIRHRYVRVRTYKEADNEDGMWRSLQIAATRAFPGCIISVAVRPTHYWLSHRAAAEMNAVSEAERLAGLSLRESWVTATRTTGPLCELRLNYADDKLLLVTLYIEKSEAPASEWYKVYLALVDKRPGDERSGSAV